MRRSALGTLALILALTAPACSRGGGAEQADVPFVQVDPKSASSTDRAIAAAPTKLRRDDEDPDAQLALAQAFLQKARETADPTLYTKADTLLGLVAEQRDGGFGGDDLELLRVLGAARRAGLTPQMLPVAVLQQYAEAMQRLVTAELELFRRGVIPQAAASGELGTQIRVLDGRRPVCDPLGVDRQRPADLRGTAPFAGVDRDAQPVRPSDLEGAAMQQRIGIRRLLAGEIPAGQPVVDEPGRGLCQFHVPLRIV